GTVVGPEGPLAGAVLLATSPRRGEALAGQPCQCEDACGKVELLDDMCGMAAPQLSRWLEAHREDTAPLARTITDAAGHLLPAPAGGGPRASAGDDGPANGGGTLTLRASR
ncbi:MAG TPA: hypothetical protein VLQ93_18880, partial [Myxococcaceae bacterium]|nr:hypothetical protein [Myxococcaceae bacterium]